MAKHVIKKDQTSTVNIDEQDSEWVLAKGVTLSGSPAFKNDNYDNVRVSVAGEIATSGNGIFLGSLMPGEHPDGAKVTLGQSGRINAEFFGIFVFGDDATIENNGQIKAKLAEAVYLEGDNVSVINNGRLRSAEGPAISLAASDVFSIQNAGRIETITGDSAVSGQDVAGGHIDNTKTGVVDGAIVFEDLNGVEGSVEIVNKGKIAQGVGAGNPGITFEDGDDRLVNRGLIGGDISFGDGDDFGDFRRGKLKDAIVQGGEGDDIFIIDKSGIAIREYFGEGNDTIKTTVSFSLGDTVGGFIETLTAIGNKNVNLTGNGQVNILNGNVGGNKLSGGGGDDILAGFGGNDVLSGGSGADDFYFYTKTGDDRIADFDVDADVIHLVSIPGIAGMGDLESHFSSAKNGDVIIDLGKHGSIRLAGIDETEISQVDFQIFSM